MKKRFFVFITILALICNFQAMAYSNHDQTIDVDSDTTILCDYYRSDVGFYAVIQRMDAGKLIWKHQTGSYTVAMVDPISPCYVNNDRVYISCLSNLTAINIETGVTEWVAKGAGFTDMGFDEYGNIYSISFDGINFAVHNKDGYQLYREDYLFEYTRPFDIWVDGTRAYIEYEDGDMERNEDGNIVRTIDITPYKPITVMLNGGAVDFSKVPVVENGRTLVPMRRLFEEMGASVDWIDDTRTVTAVKGDTEVSVSIGSDIMYVDGDGRKLDAVAMLYAGTTYVPLRAVSEAFGCNVGWDDATKTVTITQ